MIFSFLKTLLLFLFGAYAFQNISKTSRTHKQIIGMLGAFIPLSLASSLTGDLHQMLCIPITLIGAFCLNKVLFALPFRAAYSETVLAYGIVYGIYLLTGTSCSLVLFECRLTPPDSEGFWYYFYKTLPLLLVAPALVLLFRVKRFKSGMPFLKDARTLNAGMILSILVLLLSVWAFVETAFSAAFAAGFSTALVLPFLILVWWRRNIRKRYLSLLRRQEIDMLRALAQKQQTQLQTLRDEKDALSAVIHRDNKLIPAMAHAVRTYLDAPQPQNAVGRQLLHELDEMTAERTGVLHAYESDAHSIQSTGDVALDSVLQYMLEKSKVQNIRFDTAVTEFQSAQSAQNISDADVKTILADLIENAMIACGGETHKFVLAHIGTMHKRMLIRVFDSGTAFDLQTLDKIGTERITTHADSGGSGIGTQTLFALKEKYRASIILHESPQGGVYTKDVSVLFDRLDQFIVKSSRADEIRKFCTRKDMIVLRES